MTLVQQALLVLGYDVGAADSNWGDKTTAAWNQFESTSVAPITVDGLFTTAELGVVAAYANQYVPPATVPQPVATASPQPAPTSPAVTDPYRVSVSEACWTGLADVIERITNADESPTSHSRTSRLFDSMIVMGNLCLNYWPALVEDSLAPLNCFRYATYGECSYEMSAFKTRLGTTVVSIIG